LCQDVQEGRHPHVLIWKGAVFYGNGTEPASNGPFFSYRDPDGLWSAPYEIVRNIGLPGHDNRRVCTNSQQPAFGRNSRFIECMTTRPRASVIITQDPELMQPDELLQTVTEIVRTLNPGFDGASHFINLRLKLQKMIFQVLGLRGPLV
jgi:hypothetical protein